MSESSEEKTKRKLSALILNYTWVHQHSIFYENIEDCHLLVRDGNKLKRSLRKLYPDLPFLVCYRTLYRAEYGGLQAYATIFSMQKIKDMAGIAERAFSASTNHRNRRLSQGKLESTALAIKEQKPHELGKFFGRQINRYSLINKQALTQQEKQSQATTYQ